MDRRIGLVGLVAVSFAAGVAVHAVLRMPMDPPAPVPAAETATRVPSAPPPLAPPSPAELERAFGDIYKDAAWGTNAEGVGNSGSGSLARTTHLYRVFLRQFMKDHEVRSVVDAGCGDWESTHLVDWTGIDYKGYDVVPSVIEANRTKYGKPNIQFFAGDVVSTDLPAADLLIVKHVLQHLPNAAVTKFFAQLPKYKHVLITSTVGPRTFAGDNREIDAGAFRTFDPTRPPFGLPGLKLLTYWDGYMMQQVVYIPPSTATK